MLSSLFRALSTPIYWCSASRTRTAYIRHEMHLRYFCFTRTKQKSQINKNYNENTNSGGGKVLTVPSNWVKLKYTSNQPTIYPSMIQSHQAQPGDMVTIIDKGISTWRKSLLIHFILIDEKTFGFGIFDPNAKIPLRVYVTYSPKTQC